MKNSPLVALYVTLILAMSVAAWADGCLTAQAAWQTASGVSSAAPVYPVGPLPPSTECYSDAICTVQVVSHPNDTCVSSRCINGQCREPSTNSYCTGGDSAWTQTVETMSSGSATCNVWTAADQCIAEPNVTVWGCASSTVHYTDATSTCWTAWYNSGNTSCQ
jgi:hypothetical protein